MLMEKLWQIAVIKSPEVQAFASKLGVDPTTLLQKFGVLGAEQAKLAKSNFLGIDLDAPADVVKLNFPATSSESLVSLYKVVKDNRQEFKEFYGEYVSTAGKIDASESALAKTQGRAESDPAVKLERKELSTSLETLKPEFAKYKSYLQDACGAENVKQIDSQIAAERQGGSESSP